RRSSGTNTTLFDTEILPRTANYYGPNSRMNHDNKLVTFSIAQQIGENLNIQGSIARYNVYRYSRTNAGSSAAGVYLDTNRTLPDGVLNPYFNEYYTEYYVTSRQHMEIIHDARLTAVYDLKFPFMTQQIMVSGSMQDAIPDRIYNQQSEFVDPGSARFSGSLIDADTLAAYEANVVTLRNNRFYRRFYLKDGDGGHITHNDPLPGESVIIRDTPSDGITGRLSDRKYETPSVGVGLSGKYLNGRLNTLVGWRRDGFVQRTLSRRQYNHFSESEFKAPESVTNPVHIYKD